MAKTRFELFEEAWDDLDARTQVEIYNSVLEYMGMQDEMWLSLDPIDFDETMQYMSPSGMVRLTKNSLYSFDMQDDFFQFRGGDQYLVSKSCFEVAEEASEPESLKMIYGLEEIWGRHFPYWWDVDDEEEEEEEE